MATGEPTRGFEFGEVSRTVGVVFRSVLFAATVSGIVSLAVLLLSVVNDAIRPFTADAGWYVVLYATFVVPTFLAGSALARRGGHPSTLETLLPYVVLGIGTGIGALALTALRGTLGSAALLFVATGTVGGSVALLGRSVGRHHGTAGWVGVSTLGLLVAGGTLAGAAFVFFEIAPPYVWFFYATVALAVTGALAWAIYSGRFGVRTIGAAAVVGYWGGLIGIPTVAYSTAGTLLRTVPVVPTRFGIFALTLAVPAGVLAYVATGRGEFDSGSRLALAAGTALGPVLLGLAVGATTDIGRGAGLLLALFGLVPVGYYVTSRLTVHGGEGADGFLVPLVVVGGGLAGVALAGALGYAGPESWLDWQFLTSLPSPTPVEAGIYPALVGSVMLMIVVVVLAFPLGVGAAVYLEEYAPDSRTTRFIQINISNLAGVPSVVYGLLGLGVFVNLGGLTIGSVLVGGTTLALLILPIVIISAQEALRSVPDDVRQASYGMGATRWQTVKNVVLPRAMPGVLTGTILAIGRALGETAPLIMIGAPGITFSIPSGLLSATSAMPMQIYAWATSAKLTFQDNVLPAGVVTLVVVLLIINSIAIVLRNRYEHGA